MSLRVGRFLRELMSGWRITVVSPVPTPVEAPAPEAIRWVQVPAVPPTVSLPWLPEREALSARVDAVLSETSFDAAVVWCGAEFVAHERPGFPPAVVDRIDCATLQSLRNARRERNPRRALRALRHAAEVFVYERRAFRPYRAALVTGPDDRRALTRISGHPRVVAIPNGVGVEARAETGESERPTIIFTGVLGYEPNVEAVRFFATRVWPAVLARIPDAVFVVAGREPVPEVRALTERPGIELRADVPDMRQELREAWLAVAPMRSGSGIKNKVLEAWAAGRPVVLTSMATNGLELDDGARSLVVDGPAAMAERICALLEDRQRRHRLGREARRLVQARHSWGVLTARLDRMLREAAGLPLPAGAAGGSLP